MTTPTKDDLHALCNGLEIQYGLPENLLYNIAGAETQWGKHLSADPNFQGIFSQDIRTFVPMMKKTFHFDYDPSDPVMSAQTTAVFLAWCYQKFGAFDLAVAAYHWNWKSVVAFVKAKSLGLTPQMPRSTLAFIKQVAPQYYRG